MFTFLQRYNKKKRLKISQLEKELANMRDFVRVWSHDLGIPLNIFKCALIHYQEATSPASAAEINNDLMYAVGLLERMSANIRALFAGDDYNQVHLQKVAIAPWLTQLVELYKGISAAKGQTIELYIANPETIVTDEIKATQIIINLLSNAVKYTARDKRIYVNAYRDRRYLKIEVQDEGIGIPTADIERIWEPYTRLVDGVQGLGIGLYVCRKNAHILGGKVMVSSKAGKGSLFTLSIPI